MRFEVVNEQFGFVGKIEERAKIEKALESLLKEINSIGCVDDDECDYTNTLEITYGYDMDEYKVSDIKSIWKRVKESV